MIVDKFQQLNFIGDILEPHYSSNSVYIANYKISRSKLDIKLRFSKVSPRSEFAGDWYISKKKAMMHRGIINNNGLECRVIPWSAFEPLTINDKDLRGVF